MCSSDLLTVTSVTTPITTTTTNSLVGTSEVTVGQVWLTYDLSLVQDGFYNPSSGQIREYLIPGTDFQLNAINWAATGSSQPAASQRWEDYSDSQVAAVLASTGLLPLYATSISNVQRNQLLNGLTSSTPIANPWTLTNNQIWVPSSGPLQGMAIEGQTQALANLYSLTSTATSPTGALGLSGSASGSQADLPSMELGGDLTIEAWVMVSQPGTSTTVLNLGDNTLALQINAAGQAQFSGAAGSLILSDTSLVPNTWTHLAAVVQASGAVTLYGNGVAIGGGNLGASLPQQLWSATVEIGRAHV